MAAQTEDTESQQGNYGGADRSTQPFGISKYEINFRSLVGLLQIKYFSQNLSSLIVGDQKEATESQQQNYGGQTKPKPFGISRDKILIQDLIDLSKIEYFLPNLSRVIMGAQTEATESQQGKYNKTTTFWDF